jgi:hypothetical protein
MKANYKILWLAFNAHSWDKVDLSLLKNIKLKVAIQHIVTFESLKKLRYSEHICTLIKLKLIPPIMGAKAVPTILI